MRKFFFLISIVVFLGIGLILPGCEVDYYQEPEDNQGSGSSLFGDGVTVPSGFDWATIKSKKLTVTVDDKYNGQYYYQVEVFDANPIIFQDAQLLAKGVAKKGQDWVTAVNFSSDLETVYVRQISPVGLGVVKVATISGENFSVDFTPSVPTQMRSASSGSTEGSMMGLRSGGDGPSTDYPTPAINGTSVLELSGEKDVTFAWDAPTYVIPAGETFKGALTFSWKNSVIYVAGTWENTAATISLNGWTVIVQNGGKFISNVEGTFSANPNNGQGGQLIVAEGGKFGTEGKLMTLSQNDDNSKIINSGTIWTSGLSKIRYLYNYGDIYLEGVMNADSGTSSIVNKGNFIINNGAGSANALSLQGNFQNEGTVKVSEILNFPSSDFILTNTGFFEVGNLGTSNANGAKGTINNNGQFIVNENAYIELTFNIGTGALLRVKNLTMLKSKITLAHQAMLNVTGTLTIAQSGEYKIIEGPATDSGEALAKINVVDVPNYRNFYLQGELQVACSNYTDLPEKGTSEGGKTTGQDVEFVKLDEATVYIPKSDYNEGGNNNVVPGTPANPVFPIIFDGPVLTYLFEDNWPYLGDYDMNDLVLDVKPTYSLNSSNNVTELKLDVTLRAAGATKRLAVGLQLDDIIPEKISSSFSRPSTAAIDGVFQGSGLETGQSYAVIPLFDNVHQALGHHSPLMTNTIKGSENNRDPRSVVVTIPFNSPYLDLASITVNKFNVFIINGGYTGKRQEIHLAGFQPTKRADRSKFGSADDKSNIQLYTAKNNMIWGLAIPGPAKYPVEWTSIRFAYPGLESWATSAGSDTKDWYKNYIENRVYDK